jgi:hypothetical protein
MDDPATAGTSGSIPTPTTGKVARDPVTVGDHHRLQPLGPFKRSNLSPGEQPDPH